MLEDRRYGVRGRVDVRVPEDDEHARRRAPDETHLRREHEGARAFGADERARHVEPVLGEEPRQVVAGDAAGNRGIARPDERREPLRERAELPVDLGAAAALRDDARELVRRGLPDRQQSPVARDDLELVDVLVRLPGHDGVHAARVVSDHAAERAARVRRGVRSEREAVALGRVPQVVQDDARLDARPLIGGVDLQDPPEVLRRVDDDSDVAALSRQARARAAPEHGRAEPAAERERLEDVVAVPRDDDPDRDLPVVRGVARVERAAPRVEAHFAANHPSERRFEHWGQA